MSKKKAFVIIISALVLIRIFYNIYKIKDYLNEVPVIESKSVVHAYAGKELTINDLADIKKAVDVSILSGVECDTKTDAVVRKNGKSVFVGTSECIFTITVSASGKYGETREEKVTVSVHSDEQ